VGDSNGNVGLGWEAKEVPAAIKGDGGRRKSPSRSLAGSTITHQTVGARRRPSC
jgi:ribosomal protein S5